MVAIMDTSSPEKISTPWLGVKDIAPRLGVSDRTVRRLIAQHEIGHHIVGGQVRIPLSDLDAYLERIRVDAVS